MSTPSSYPQFQQVDLAGVVLGGGTPGGGSSATSDALLADIKAQLIQVFGAIDGLELITGNIKIDAASIGLNVDELEAKIDAVNGLLTAIDASTTEIELRTRPLIPAARELWGAGDGEYVAAADASRRAVKIINNTGESNGRNAATLFIDYNGNTPDRVNHSQFIKPGEFGFLDCPSLDFRIVAEGVAALEGAYIVVRFE
jgi:hypothetical protein